MSFKKTIALIIITLILIQIPELIAHVIVYTFDIPPSPTDKLNQFVIFMVLVIYVVLRGFPEKIYDKITSKSK